MKKIGRKINEITKRIKEICENPEHEYKASKEELYKLFYELESTKIKSESDIITLIEIHRNLTGIRNRKASYLENKIGQVVLAKLPFSIRMQDEEIPEDVLEVLHEDYDNSERIALKLSGKLLKYGKEIIASKEDKSKRYKNRVKEALRMLNELQHFYVIEGIKEIFQSKILDKDSDLQFFALYGLEIYYAHQGADELTRAEEKELEKIIKTTKTREIASTCCQVLIYADKIDEFGAMMRIDSWKDRNWRRS